VFFVESYLKKNRRDNVIKTVSKKSARRLSRTVWVIRLKGYTSWAIGYSVANLARSLLRDQRSIQPVSLLSKGFYGIGDDVEVFLSLPAMLGRSGVVSVAQIQLTDEEKNRLQNSAKTLWEIQQQLLI
ncbi:hypothetical protein ZOSMA_9038G00010, partial [Zostera marina]